MAKLTKAELVATNQWLQNELGRARIALAVSRQLFSMTKDLLQKGSETYQEQQEKNGPEDNSVPHP